MNLRAGCRERKQTWIRHNDPFSIAECVRLSHHRWQEPRNGKHTFWSITRMVTSGVFRHKGTRRSSFFNHFAPWDTRATTLLRPKVPTGDVPVALYVPIAYLKRLGARLAESSHVAVFKGVPWENVRGAWYREPTKWKWKRLLAKEITNYLTTAATHSHKMATKDQVPERAREVAAACTRRDDNIRKLDDIVNDGDTKRTKQESWNAILARTCEGYNSVDGNILCPACMNATPNLFRNLSLTQFAGGTAAVHLAVQSYGVRLGEILDAAFCTCNFLIVVTLKHYSFELTLRLSVPSFVSSGNRVN